MAESQSPTSEGVLTSTHAVSTNTTHTIGPTVRPQILFTKPLNLWKLFLKIHNCMSSDEIEQLLILLSPICLQNHSKLPASQGQPSRQISTLSLSPKQSCCSLGLANIHSRSKILTHLKERSVVAVVNQIQIKVHVPQTVKNYSFSSTTPSRRRMWFRKQRNLKICISRSRFVCHF